MEFSLQEGWDSSQHACGKSWHASGVKQDLTILVFSSTFSRDFIQCGRILSVLMRVSTINDTLSNCSKERLKLLKTKFIFAKILIDTLSSKNKRLVLTLVLSWSRWCTRTPQEYLWSLCSEHSFLHKTWLWQRWWWPWWGRRGGSLIRWRRIWGYIREYVILASAARTWRS